MAKKEHVDKRFTQDVHIRLTEAEAAKLQKKADEMGLTLSKAGRMLMFRRQEQPAVFSERESGQLITKVMSELKAVFKKSSADNARFIAAYEKSLLLKNRSGEPAVSTDQTVRMVEGIVYNQMKIQDGLNEVIRVVGGTEIHVAAKPPVGTVVGDTIAGKRTVSETPAPEVKKEKDKQIPFEFTTMANITIDGSIVAEPEFYQNGKYEMIRLVVQVEERDGAAKKFYRVDCTDFKSRYTSVLEYLKPGKNVLIAGDHRYTLGTYNGRQSDSAGTIVMSKLKLL